MPTVNINTTQQQYATGSLTGQVVSIRSWILNQNSTPANKNYGYIRLFR